MNDDDRPHINFNFPMFESIGFHAEFQCEYSGRDFLAIQLRSFSLATFKAISLSLPLSYRCNHCETIGVGSASMTIHERELLSAKLLAAHMIYAVNFLELAYLWSLMFRG